METIEAVRTPEPTPVRDTPSRRRNYPAWTAVGLFAVFAAAVLTHATSMLEPDDYAYRASIVALTHGHLTLTNAEYQSLAASLSSGTGPFSSQGIMQWVHLPSGSWISEKNPGYPFLALPFALIGALRLAPLFYGGLACIALFFGARRWLGRWGGTAAVAMFLGSGAAVAFAWRATMPTFTDASLIAAGSGALLWTLLAKDHSVRRRTVMGLLAFLAFEAATFVRYTDVVFLLVALAAVAVAHRRVALPRRMLAWWLGSAVVFGVGVLGFDQAVYGNALKTGYSSGEITFSLSSVSPNLHHMPTLLLEWMPATLVALAAIGWITLRWTRAQGATRAIADRDFAVAAWLTGGWFGLWALYSAYDWTARMSGFGGGIHLIRFYVPAIGVIALLAAWLVTRLRWAAPVIVLAGVLATGVVANPVLTGHDQLPGGGPGGPTAPSGQGGPGGPGAGQLPPGGGPPGA